MPAVRPRFNGLDVLRSKSVRLLTLLTIVVALSLHVNFILTRALINATIPEKDVPPVSHRENVSIDPDTKTDEITLAAGQAISKSEVDEAEMIGMGGKVVDILSVASNKRPDYVRTQRNTWANHPLVRNFFNVTEDLDNGQGAHRSCHKLPIHKVLKVPKFCRERYLNTDSELHKNIRT